METSRQEHAKKVGFLDWLFRALKKLNAGINHDFCPGFNPYVYWLKQPVGWVVCGAFFSALVGFFIGPQGFVLMWSFLALLAIGAAWPRLSMKGLECRLSFDKSRAHENGSITAIVEVTNKWPIPVFGLMVQGEFLLDLLDDDNKIAIGLQRVPAWSVSRFSWSFEPKQRGILPYDEPILMNGFPFGLYQSQKPIETSKQTIVWPADCQLKGSPGLDGTQFNIAGMISDRPGVDGDVIGIREYRQGDSLKHVHWAKTATIGRLIVQERQTKAQRPFEVVIDLSPKNHRGDGGQSSYEWAIRVASSICTQLHRHQAEVTAVCLGLPADYRNQSSNVNGIGKLLDFFSTLPKFETVKAQSKSTKPTANLSTSNQTKRFYVCTSLSHSPFEKANMHRVELDAKRFDPDFVETTSDDESGPTHKSNISITSSEDAAADLRAGWSEGVCYGA